MLRVTVEVVPHGREDLARVVGFGGVASARSAAARLGSARDAQVGGPMSDGGRQQRAGVLSRTRGWSGS